MLPLLYLDYEVQHETFEGWFFQCVFISESFIYILLQQFGLIYHYKIILL